jgi:hypothetical protein
MKPSEKQLRIATNEGRSAAFNRPAEVARLDQLLRLCPYNNKALALAWRNGARSYFGHNSGWPQAATSATPED